MPRATPSNATSASRPASGTARASANYAAGVCRAFAGHKLSKAQLAAALSFHRNTCRIETASRVMLWKQGSVGGQCLLEALKDQTLAVITFRAVLALIFAVPDFGLWQGIKAGPCIVCAGGGGDR